jgi:hypothetical protein
MADSDSSQQLPWSSYFLFVRWARLGAQSPQGHLESDYVARGATENEALTRAGAFLLAEVRSLLDALISASVEGRPGRRWIDPLRDEDES